MSRRSNRLEKALAKATTYAEWQAVARELDSLDGSDDWQRENESPDYDHRLLASRVKLLGKLRRQQDIDQLMFRLREELHGNLGNRPDGCSRHGQRPRG